MQTITRKEKILAFIHDYYFGYGVLVAAMRLITGPLFLLCGIFVLDDSARFRWAIILYAVYFIAKPVLWVLFRPAQYQEERLEVDLNEERLLLKDELGNESSIRWETFKNIKEASFYYVFIVFYYSAYQVAQENTAARAKIWVK
ncbi:hypothetical protein [Rufibacter roseus]|uniref:Uncharacterized protein n=1 Tax=Rufibacter roseus TaxID=1567108 RepID=A0ABW2DQV9_9BACT|nr:hypothetical protein [Rufibacter roseus]